MIERDHPFFFLESLFANRDAVFHFSRYVYTPDSLFDAREPIEIKGYDVTVEWLDLTMGALQNNQELAIHSDVRVNGRTWHIPMIDLSARHLGSREIDRIRAFSPHRVFLASTFFRTGRSFHAYSTTLLSPKEWIDFMGRLLLVNPRDDEQIVDSRWIGHRLIAGYCSLRFSNNSGQYLGIPKQVGIRSFLEGGTRAPEHYQETGP